MSGSSLWARRGTLGALAGTLLVGGGLGAAALRQTARDASPDDAETAGPAKNTSFGLNHYGLFLPGVAERKPALDALASFGRLGMPFVRFPASAQWAGDWKVFDADPQAWWEVMDKVFAAAEHHGVKLVPVVFWHSVALAFHMGEPMQAWADPASRTRQFSHRFTQSFVERYDRSPALMMYEFTNELNAWADLPNVLQFWPKHDPTMPERSPMPQDRLSTAQIHDFVEDFARTIRASSRKPISMGSDFPRDNAWHLARRSWDTDSRQNFIDNLDDLTPPAIDALSVHLYSTHYGTPHSIFPDAASALQAIVAAARRGGRLSFVGEFGSQRLSDLQQERKIFNELLTALTHSGIDYAALWNYSATPFQPDWDVAETGPRAYQIEALMAANRAR
ncbi:cellulase family glycosylhydrolase [Novosphingobium rosa]|uniref:cellulase family glycosylhydrolase n=1 Tax=Novosphingobium rosa TaxID=76978 RepID=UPI00082E33D7|nr:cellulase family glycosylhydrolase [Novosphingobium rosa]